MSPLTPLQAGLISVLNLVALLAVWIGVALQWKARREAARHLKRARQLHAQVEWHLEAIRRAGLEVPEHLDA